MDMLVKLYELPEASSLDAQLLREGIVVRRAMAHEKGLVVDWVGRQFSPKAKGWKSECEVGFSRLPITCFIAVKDHRVIGFSCYEVTARSFLGPIGVDASCRLQGVGRRLLLSSLNALRALGYAYAIIGHVGPGEFFEKAAGALEIAGSTPGIFPVSGSIG